eukprot:TRINITY_DN11731_c0_g1_i1.p1 TRINITY_DN11731_c0_g1~~TRINITY_DN11731_c0_g1_i1.p1  ORF type:complete len:210 (+),score=30.18 TRINITY_DN11731_c0_g1_i1:17-646(+)
MLWGARLEGCVLLLCCFAIGVSQCGCPCVNGFCDSNNSCVSCFPNYYGTLCTLPCTCLHGICDSGLTGTGTCQKCKEGFWGRDCDRPCECALGLCSEATGTCTVCTVSDVWGPYCNNTCNCTHGASCSAGIAGDGSCSGAPIEVAPPVVDNSLNGYYAAIIAFCVLIVVLCALVVFIAYRHYVLENDKFLLKYFPANDQPDDQGGNQGN